MLKRLIPKDAVKLDGDNIKIGIINVISAIPISELPGNLIDELTVLLDGEEILSANVKEHADKVRIIWEGTEYTLETIKTAEGGVLPVGGKMEVVFPNIKNFAVGETHTFEISIAIVSMKIKFERELQAA
jgi:hypothetical protein